MRKRSAAEQAALADRAYVAKDSPIQIGERCAAFEFRRVDLQPVMQGSRLLAK